MGLFKCVFSVFVAIGISVSCPGFSQENDFEWSRIPNDTTIVSGEDATVTINTPAGKKTIHYIDGKRIAAERKKKEFLLSALLLVLFATSLLILFFEKKHKTIESLENDLILIKTHSDSLSLTVATLLENQVRIVKEIIDKHDSLKRTPEGTFFDKYESLQNKISNYNDYLEPCVSTKSCGRLL